MDRFTKIVRLDTRDDNDVINKVPFLAGSANTDLLFSLTADGGTPQTVEPTATIKLYVQWDYANKSDADKNKTDYYLDPTKPGYNITIEAGKIRLPLDGNIINKAGIGRLQFEIIETNGDSTDSFTTVADYLVKENPAWDAINPDENAPNFYQLQDEDHRIKGDPVFSVYDELAGYLSGAKVRYNLADYEALDDIAEPAGAFNAALWRDLSVKALRIRVDDIINYFFVDNTERDEYFTIPFHTTHLKNNLMINVNGEIYKWTGGEVSSYDPKYWEYSSVKSSDGISDLGNIKLKNNASGINFFNEVDGIHKETINQGFVDGELPTFKRRTAAADLIISDKTNDALNPNWTNSLEIVNYTYRTLVLDFTNAVNNVMLEIFVNSKLVQIKNLGNMTLGENTIILDPVVDVLAGDVLGFNIYSNTDNVVLKSNFSNIPYQRFTVSEIEIEDFITGAVGAAGNVQFSDGVDFASDANFTFNSADEKLGVGTDTPKATIHASNNRDVSADPSVLDNYLAILDNGTQAEGKINGIALTYSNNTVKSALVMESMENNETRLCLYVDKGAGLERSFIINNADELGEILAAGKVALLEGNPIQGDFETRYGFAGEFSSVIDTGDGRATIVLDTGDAVVSTMIAGSRIVISNSTNYNGTYTIYSRDIGNNRITLTAAFTVTDTGSWDSYAAKALAIEDNKYKFWDKNSDKLIYQTYIDLINNDIIAEYIRGGQNRLKILLDVVGTKLLEDGAGGKDLLVGTAHTGDLILLTADLQRLIVSGANGSFNFLTNKLINIGNIGVNESTPYTTADIRSAETVTDFNTRTQYSMYINKIGSSSTGDYFSSILFGSDNQQSAALVVQDAGSGNRTRMKLVLDNGVDFDSRFTFNYTGDFTATNNVIATEKLIGADLNIDKATMAGTKKYVLEESDFGTVVDGKIQLLEGVYDLMGREVITTLPLELEQTGVITIKNGGIIYSGTGDLYYSENYENVLTLQNVGHKFTGGGRAFNITNTSGIFPVIRPIGAVFDYSGPSPNGIGVLNGCYIVSTDTRFVNFSDGIYMNNMVGIIFDKLIAFSNSTATKTFFNINGIFAGLVRFNTLIVTLDDQDTLFNFDPASIFSQGVYVSEVYATFLNNANEDNNIFEALSFDYTTPGFNFANNFVLKNSKISANQYIIGNSEDTTIFDTGEYARIASLPQFRGSGTLERFTSSSNGELTYTGKKKTTIKIETNVTFTTASASTQSITAAVGFTSHVKTLVTSFTPIDNFIVTATPHGLSNGDTIRLGTDGTLPTGLFPSIFYYVRNSSPNDFQVSTTPAGAIVDFTTAGTGTAHVSEGYIIPQSVVETSTTSATFKTVHTSALADIQTGDIIEIFVACLTSSSDIKVKSENTIIY